MKVQNNLWKVFSAPSDTLEIELSAIDSSGWTIFQIIPSGFSYTIICFRDEQTPLMEA